MVIVRPLSSSSRMSMIGPRRPVRRASLPGIPAGYADRVREALRTGLRGPIVDIRDEDDSGLTITID